MISTKLTFKLNLTAMKKKINFKQKNLSIVKDEKSLNAISIKLWKSRRI